MFVNSLRSPSLGYPAGETPGLDYGHIGCAGGKLLWSSTSLVTSTGTAAVQDWSTNTKYFKTAGNCFYKCADIGPSLEVSGTTISPTGRDTGLYTTYTAAFIAHPVTLANNQCVFQTDSSSTIGGMEMGFVSSSGLKPFIGAISVSPTDKFPMTLPNGINHPYFCIFSANSTTTNILALQMDTGQIYTVTTTGLTFLAGDGGYSIGAGRVGHLNGGWVSNVMVSANNFLSIPEMVEWANDPWSFWYPSVSQTVPDLDVGAVIIPPPVRGGMMLMMGI